MTDTEIPSASPKRRATILGRLTAAVGEQNWFAVVLDVHNVIVGVVIGFQVTGWGQDRADRVHEQTYLRQLAGDLRETENASPTSIPSWHSGAPRARRR